MPDYRVYDGVLRSALSWPELPTGTAAGDPDWVLTREAPVSMPAGATRVGQHRYAGDVEVSLWRADELWRVQTSDIGDFDLTGGGRSITWRPTEGASEELARFDLLGRVLPLALHLGGAVSLHGSAVATPAGAVILAGPKGHGKSTLALALAQHGAPLLGDDVAVVEHGPAVSMVRPGYHAVRLWADAAERLGTGRYGAAGAVGRKLLIHSIPEPLLATCSVPLAAVYLLDPRASQLEGEGDGRQPVPAVRRPLPAVEATRRLLGQATAGNLLGGGLAVELLERVAELVRRAPVHELTVERDFVRLDEVASTILGWHGGGFDLPHPAAAGECSLAATGTIPEQGSA